MPKAEAAVPASGTNTATSTVPPDSGEESASSCSEEEAAEAPTQESSGVGDDVDRFEGGFRGGSDEGTEERSGAQERGKRGGGELEYASTAVRHRPFRKSTAFLVGHRNRLDDKALDVCDFLVHVEQVGRLALLIDVDPLDTLVYTCLYLRCQYTRVRERVLL